MKKRIILILISFIFAFMGGLGFYTFQKKVFEPVTVFKANRVILKGNLITEKDFDTDTIYGGNVNKDYILNPQDFIGKYAKLDFAEGDYFRYEKVSDTLDANELYKELLQPGESAIGVKTDLTKCVGGIPKSGDKVNIIAIHQDRATGTVDMAKTIMQQVEILSVINKQGNNVNGEQKGLAKTQVQNYVDRTPDVVVLKVPTEKEALLAVHTNVVLSLNSKEYKEYDPNVIENVFADADKEENKSRFVVTEVKEGN